MPSFFAELRDVFLCSGDKKVSKTDVAKNAYVLTGAQRHIMASVGLSPGRSPDVPMVMLHDLLSGEAHEVSYYESVREGSGRTPEQRFGRVTWLTEGDHVLLATDGVKVFVHRLSEADKDRSAEEEIIRPKVERVYGQFDQKKLAEKARSAGKVPKKKTVKSSSYERSPEIVAYTQKRANYCCEIEGCGYEGFVKEDGARYIEVHHVQPLSEGGEDSIENTIAACPNCHRELHFSEDKEQLARSACETVKAANLKYQGKIGFQPE